MNIEAERAVMKVTEKLEECRNILDNEMYWKKSVELNSPEFKKLRSIYDAICKVIDLT
jgi:hypothetical protein